MVDFRKIPTNVYLLGVISFFNDVASEMLYPILPIFLVQLLGAPVYVIGIIEGVAEGVSSFLKSYFGHISDKYQKRVPFVVGGYAASAVSKFIIALAYSWPIVFIGRFLDRFGKGMRTGARDALLLSATDKTNKGLIFGLHRSFDSAGAVIGPLIALILLHYYHENIRLILYIAIFPSLVGLLLFFFLQPVKKIRQGKENPTFFFKLKKLSPEFRLFLLTLAIFSLGNSTDSFLILRSKQLGLSLVAVILIYVIYNVAYTLLSTPAGILADKLGAKKVFSIGLVIYVLVYMGFALNKNLNMIWLLFVVYGAYIALTDGVSKALIGNYTKIEESGTAYGISQTIISIFTLLASVVGGLLWSAISPSATFLFGALCALVALILFVFTPSP